MASTVAAWPTVALGEVLRKSDEWVDLKPDTEYAQVTVRLWGKGVALRGRVQGGQIAASSQLRVRQNQFILSRIDARNGAFGLVTPELDGAVVSNDFPVFNLDESRIIPAYLNWLSKTHDFVEMCQRASEGTTNRVRLKEERFLALNIPLPPLEEQRRNVARIEALAGRIAEARGLRQAATAETIAARYSWWRAWRQRLLAPNISTEQLGDIAWITSGGTPARDNASYWGGNVPWVKSGELNDNDIYSTEECITEAAIEGSSAKLFPPDTVLVALYGHTRGKTARLRISATTNQACCAILPCEQLDAAYLQYWLKSLYLDMREDAYGGAQPNWSGQMVKAIRIAIPPLAEQQHHAEVLEALDETVERLSHLHDDTSKELDALLPAILDKAFRGEL